MTEPRMRQRHKGQQFPNSDLEAFLFSNGSPLPAPQPTLATLDAIITDFIIETCHEAALRASLAGRQKIKLDDFKFMLRKDEEKLGRVEELQALDRQIKEQKKIFSEEVVSKKEEKTEREKGKRKKRKRDEDDESAGEEDGEDAKDAKKR
ncbi:hypothetical protein EJ05DRAFT_484627 [Pseudovirgaria hyperparasitica]|uniref:Transcription initiation factor TFIID subunit 13 n=1 Tax=Pseudovirgaria hyperparasitica TaxID=470096 RepID=A0A6A6WAK4_9PEZI|nr:uncharacterized protein EJ05DRAFT_484627 [Pseudovirgaria hyperparasitica]KAF2759703.1 hypothetical protein EJ05DRAFT_484627 [Pseudovirgaria hyperparasitica]